ncbi:MAG: cytochrome-c oxidase [Sphingobacteriales bacterium 50-39]|nr:cytochrome c [Sphingobacteriales bacterium]OJW60115.1 MAG: cytochrome-c oxidase [Sphingobacteriales bacterium 50-39]
MQLFDDHKKLFGTAFLFFLILSIFVVILPALDIQRNNAPLPGGRALSEDAEKGRLVFIANGCVACHTQQVRSTEMDRTWGSRPSVAADYARVRRTDLWRNTATLMGTERTGPDLTNIGARQPADNWHLAHLFNPRIVVKESIMPAYPWMFEIKKTPSNSDKVVSVPEEFLEDPQTKVVATQEALYLVAYLQSLKQAPLPDGRPLPQFLVAPGASIKTATSDEPPAKGPDGAQLYATNCQSCHQPNGEGLKGAFPSLKGSKVVLDDNPELQATIIMNGYTGRVSEGYGPMPPVGVNNNLTPEEVTAIMNYERTSWGNNGKKAEVAAIEKFIQSLKDKQ